MKILFYCNHIPANSEWMIRLADSLKHYRYGKQAIDFYSNRPELVLPGMNKILSLKGTIFQYTIILVIDQESLLECETAFPESHFVFIRISPELLFTPIYCQRLIAVLDAYPEPSMLDHIPRELLRKVPLYLQPESAVPAGPKVTISSKYKIAIAYQVPANDDEIFFGQKLIGAVNGSADTFLRVYCDNKKQKFLRELANNNIDFSSEQIPSEGYTIYILHESEAKYALHVKGVALLINQSGMINIPGKDEMVAWSSGYFPPQRYSIIPPAITSAYITDILEEARSIKPVPKSNIASKEDALHLALDKLVKLICAVRNKSIHSHSVKLIDNYEFYFIESRKVYVLTNHFRKIIGEMDEAEYNIIKDTKQAVGVSTLLNIYNDYNESELIEYLVQLYNQNILLFTEN
jgi:hypothetical protein